MSAAQLSLRLLASLILVAATGPSAAQKLPSPSRTVFKCEAAGKVIYSDSPCLGAQRIDIEPTRGASKLSGTERIGEDVRREQLNEQMAEALKPLLGENPQQRAKRLHRARLDPQARLACARLDRDIAAAEKQEKSASSSALAPMQKRLFGLRVEYRDLRC